MNLSEHFKLEELTRSETAKLKGIDNTPSDLVIENLRALCEYTLEPLRQRLGKPIRVSSGYRSPEVNKAIGGASNSQHVEGKAADITVAGMTVDELFEEASKYVAYDQVIQEFGRWVHLSYSNPLRRMRLWAVKTDGKTEYLHSNPQSDGSETNLQITKVFT